MTRLIAMRRLEALLDAETLRPIQTTYLELKDGDVLLVAFPEPTPHRAVVRNLDALERVLRKRGLEIEVFAVPAGTTISALTSKKITPPEPSSH